MELCGRTLVAVRLARSPADVAPTTRSAHAVFVTEQGSSTTTTATTGTRPPSR